jgi:heat shock protein HslJ
MKKLIAIFVFSGLLLVSCKTAPINDFNKVKQVIENNTWVLQDEIGGVTGFNGQDVTMKFMEDNGLQAVGFAGCNNYFSSVQLFPDRISFTQPGSTMMACPNLDDEKAFLDLLSQVNGYELSGSEFKLFKDKIILMRFKAK